MDVQNHGGVLGGGHNSSSHGVPVPALQGFLLHDEIATRKSFTTWWNEVCLRSPYGRSISKAKQQRIHQICHPISGEPVLRERQPEEVNEVLKIWEALPLRAGSSEWKKARVRQIRDLLLSGRFNVYQADGLGATSQEITEARCWLREFPNGRLDGHRSIHQPICYKDLRWSFAAKQSMAVLASLASDVAPDNLSGRGGTAIEGAVRISAETLKKLIDGTYPMHLLPSFQQGNGSASASYSNEGLRHVSEDEEDARQPIKMEDIPWYAGDGPEVDPPQPDQIPEMDTSKQVIPSVEEEARVENNRGFTDFMDEVLEAASQTPSHQASRAVSSAAKSPMAQTQGIDSHH
ncbi:MAG: hypothetical protein Q9218_007436, partial [Villophora microphyllina]